MALRTARPTKRRRSSHHQFRKRVPADVFALAKGQRVTFHLPTGRGEGEPIVVTVSDLKSHSHCGRPLRCSQRSVMPPSSRSLNGGAARFVVGSRIRAMMCPHPRPTNRHPSPLSRSGYAGSGKRSPPRAPFQRGGATCCNFSGTWDMTIRAVSLRTMWWRGKTPYWLVGSQACAMGISRRSRRYSTTAFVTGK